MMNETCSDIDATVSRKLGLISEVMADGYQFLTVRDLVTGFQDRAIGGDPMAQDFMRALDVMYRLCTVAQRSSAGLL